MRKLALIISIAVVLAGFGGAAFAAGSERSAVGPPELLADAPFARLATRVDGNGSGVAPALPNFIQQRAVGVQKVKNPAVGVFCIKPVPTGSRPVNVATAVPSITLDATGTQLTGVPSVRWRSTSTLCPSGFFEIDTFIDNQPINNVAFTFVVP